MNAIHDNDRVPETLAGLDLNLVVAFDALTREVSVTRAAHRLGVTQSAMSHALARLRALLDDPLLIRVKGAMVLTPRAEALIVPLRSALVTITRALARPDPFDPAVGARVFRLASPDLFDVLMLPPLLVRMRAVAPAVDLTVTTIVEGRVAERLETGDLDLAVLPRLHDVPAPDASKLVRRTLFHDRFACFVRAGHPLLSRAGRLSLPRFAAASHVVVSPEGHGPGLVDRALAREGRARRVALRVPSFGTALSIVERSDLVLTAPAVIGRAGAEASRVMVRPPLPLPDHSVDLIWHERFGADAAHRWFREQLVALADEELGDLRPGAR